jgi:hypothetical protein
MVRRRTGTANPVAIDRPPFPLAFGIKRADQKARPFSSALPALFAVRPPLRQRA